MLTFRFTGNLGRYFRKITLNVSTPAQGLRLLFAQSLGFKREFLKTNMRMRIAGEDIYSPDLNFHMHTNIKKDSIVIFAPIIEGAIEGIAVATWVMIGLTVASVALSVYMLTTIKTQTSAEASAADTITNNSFTSVDNRIGQGSPVPLLLGEMVVGSNVISLGIDTTNNMDWEASIS